MESNLENIPFWVAPSYIDVNDFYLFRDKGMELKVKYEKGVLLNKSNFTNKELEYLDNQKR